MSNKNLTIGEVEKMRSALNTAIAEAIQKFESDTGMRVEYIHTVRRRDEESKRGTPCVEPYSEDRGEVVTVNVNLNMEFD